MDFSVIIPSFNDPRILEAIASVDAQSYPRDKIEILVMDGGSQPGLLNQIRQRLHPKDILVCERDQGIFDAINKGIARASGAVLLTLGSDDKLASEEAVAAFRRAFQDPQVAYACAAMAYTDQDWVPIRDWPATLATWGNLALGRQVSHFGFACRPEVYKQIGPFELKYDVAADFDFFVRLAKAHLRGVCIAERLVLMRIGGNSSKNLRNVLRGNRQVLCAGFTHCGPLIGLHFLFKPLVKLAQFARARRPAMTGCSRRSF